MRSFILAGTLATVALAADAGPWEQCGGNNWTGPTTCVAGYTCTINNEWYSQCIPGNAPPPTTLTTSTTSVPTPTNTPLPVGNFKWFGVNEAGAEFGKGIFPGQWGTEFIFPDNSAIQNLVGQGYNMFRVAFSMERMVPNTLTGSFNAAYLRNLTESVNYITNAGAWAVLDPHNFGRYYDNIITDTNAFQAFWKTLAGHFVSNSRVVFDTNNEYHTMSNDLVRDLNQAAINGIRASGANSQFIFVEGNAWSGAWSWVSSGNGASLVNLQDPQNKIIYEMHQYLDSDHSGTSPTCVSPTIGAERLLAATAWLRANGKLGILGEFAGGANSVCQTAVTGLLEHLKANSDVWTGALWWAGGPWWGDYIFGFEPPSGTGYTYYNNLLKNYVPR